MKVENLSGLLLDYWVAKAEGNLTYDSTSPENATVEHYGYGGEIEGRSPLKSWAPSSEWDSGGPIIERERIATYEYDGWTALVKPYVSPGGDLLADVMQHGETLLEAAMRAFVASKFGDMVPDGDANAD